MKSEWNPWTAHNWSAPEAEACDASLPYITLGVLNYNRCDDLRRTLDVLTHAVQYPRYEIVLIDNGSTDGSIEMARAEFPNVILHEVGKNLGVSSRNFQTQLAHGKYLFSFDDDTCPATPGMILRIVQHMEAHPEIDALSGTYYQPLTGLTETQGWELFRNGPPNAVGFSCLQIVEGGVCFRISTLRRVEGYEPSFVCYADGMDLVLQLVKINAGIYLAPAFATLHFASPVGRISNFRAYANVRNTIWAIFKHWPLPAVTVLLPVFLFRRCVAIIMHPETAKANLNGFLDGIAGSSQFVSKGPKLSWNQVFTLKRFYIALFRWA